MQLDKEIENLLDKNSLFRNLTADQKSDFANILNEKSFKDNEYIVKEGEKSDAIYFILEGGANVIKKETEAGENEEIIAKLTAGDTIGEVTLIDKQPRSASVRAFEYTRTIYFLVGDLEQISKEEFSIAAKVKLNFAAHLSEYLRGTNVKTVTERKEHKAQITKITNYDAVTGLPNDFLLEQHINKIIKKENINLTLFVIEILDFPVISGIMGSDGTNNLLSHIAGRLEDHMSSSELIARIGKNNFALLYKDKVQDKTKEAERCIRAFSDGFELDKETLEINITVGIASYPEDAVAASELLSRATLASDAAKFKGENTFAVYEHDMHERVAKRRQIIADMHVALNENQFALYYQPQINLKDNRLVGAEALIRWEHPDKGMISPVDFIPVAESTDFIIKLSDWVLKEGFRQAQYWEKSSPTPVRIAINLSPKQFSQKNLIDLVSETLDAEGVNPKLIELEVTESLMLDNIDQTVDVLNCLANLGLILAIDDFGTGYSSLSYLSRLPAHKLKVDQAFVKDLDKHPENKDIIRCIIGLAKSLNMETIAEGIETQENLNLLRSLGCDEGQGYFFSKPLSASEFEAKYLNGEG